MVTPYLVEPYALPEAVAETEEQAGQPRIPTQIPEKVLNDIKPRKAEASQPVVPVEAEPIEKAAVEETPAEETQEKLSQTYISNLKKIYGKNMPENMGSGARFGYIVD
jgi:hypothetical protein